MFATTTGHYRSATEINSAMGRVYGQMALAVLTSMVVSALVSSSPALMALLFGTALKWVIIFAPLVAIFAIGLAFEKMSKSTLQILLHGFAALMGLSFATIFVVYTIGSIVSAFMGAGVLFGVMSFYGYFTKRDLSGWGSFLMVGLIAIVIASIINVVLAGFWPGAVDNALWSSVISALAIIIFTGLTAYDTQRIREMVTYENDGKAEIMGALSLYMNFINIFLSLLQLFGNRE
jgi:FtsH-binding integral membrane protein